MKSAKRNRRPSRKLAVETLENRCLLAAGALDPTFGQDGVVIEDIGGKDEDGVAIAVYTDPGSSHFGKIVSAGTRENNSGDWIIRRLNPDGTLDGSFSGDGVVKERNDGRDGAADVLIQPDGKIVVGGYSEVEQGIAPDFRLIRYNTDGSRDTSFGGDGQVRTDFGGDEGVVSMAQMPDGRILAVGNRTLSGGGNNSFVMARYQVDGSLDNSLGNGGIVETPVTVFPDAVLVSVSGVALVPVGDGFLVAGAISDGQGSQSWFGNADVFVAKYNTDGTLDDTFGLNGVTTLDRWSTDTNPSEAINMLPDGRIQLGYDTTVGTFIDPETGSELDDVRLVLARLNPDGTPDTTFGDQGVFTSGFDPDIRNYGVHSLSLQADGKILVGGDLPGQIFTSRHNPDGSFDASFGDNGLATPELAEYWLDEPARDIAVQPDGKILVTTTARLKTAPREDDLAIFRFQGDAVGDVTAIYEDSGLTLIGDSTANDMRLIVSADAAGESVLIEGLNGTTINGFSEVTFGTLDNLVMDLGAGADSVLIEWQGRQGLIGTWLEIDMGKGRDVLEWRGVAQWLGALVDTGGGADHVILRADYIPYTYLEIKTRGGNDRVEMYGRHDIGYDGGIDLGKGDDVLQGDPDAANKCYELSAVGGDGFDRVFEPGYFDGNDLDFDERIDCPDTGCVVPGNVKGKVVNNPKHGNVLVLQGDVFDNDIQLSSPEFGTVVVESGATGTMLNGLLGPLTYADINRVRVDLHSGEDSVLTDGLLLPVRLIVNTGYGDDTVEIRGGHVRSMKIDTGGGVDNVLLDTVTADRRTKIATGWGEDKVTIRDSVFAGKVILEGGLDDDTLHLLGENLFNKGLVEDFEL